MIKKRLIPKLQMQATAIGSAERLVLVTTLNFDRRVEVGDPVSQAKIYEAQAADELLFLDISGGHIPALAAMMRKVAEQIFMPITAGGGVRSIDDIRTLLANGADKVSLNSAALKRPALITEASTIFGAQCVVISIDYKKGEGGYRVYASGGSVDTGRDPVEWAREVERLGAGEILLTSIDNDGGRKGLDLALSRAVSDAVSLPVITSGGCGRASHFVAGFKEGGCDAVSAGAYFCFKDENPMQTRAQIKNAGIPIRLLT